jgi:hypothetical protein
MTKRHLSETEIDDICNSLKSIHPDDFVEKNAAGPLRKSLVALQIYPQMIPKLKSTVIRQYERSQINPCEMVGCIASTSIGETTTQASLNSFHSSGMAKANLTTGVVRLKELLSATKNNKTPSLSVNFQGDAAGDLKSVRRFCHTWMEQVLMRDLVAEWTVEKSPPVEKWYEMWKAMYDAGFSPSGWRLRLKLNKNLLWSCGKTLQQIVDICDSHLNGGGHVRWVFSPISEAIIDVWCDGDTLPSFADNKNLEGIHTRLAEWLEVSDKTRLFLKNVLKPNIDTVLVSGLRDLEKCYYTQGKDGRYSVETKGGYMADLSTLCSANYNGISVDMKRSWSNNMWEIIELLGIEATVAFLHSEFAKNISVSRRHLELLIDWMTNSGTIQSVSRYGLDIAKVGPLSKASFEQPLDAFFDAANSRQREIITGVSAAVATGNLAKGGTGGFQLLLDVNKLASVVEEEPAPQRLQQIVERQPEPQEEPQPQPEPQEDDDYCMYEY